MSRLSRVKSYDLLPLGRGTICVPVRSLREKLSRDVTKCVGSVVFRAVVLWWIMATKNYEEYGSEVWLMSCGELSVNQY